MNVHTGQKEVTFGFKLLILKENGIIKGKFLRSFSLYSESYLYSLKSKKDNNVYAFDMF